MIQKILHFSQIEQATFKILCGDSTGTAFIVGSADKRYVITSNHTIISGNEIMLERSDDKIPLIIILQIPECDIAILQLRDVGENLLNSLPLSLNEISYDETWESYGYLGERMSRGRKFSGKIALTSNDSRNNIDLECDQYTITQDFSGLSGAPLIVNQHVVGVICYDLTGTLAATSFRNIEEKLDDLKIPFFIESKGALPDTIHEYISDTSPNELALEEINILIEKENTNYIVLTGSPGSGKTTIAAQIEFDNEKYVLIDRYFIKVPDNDPIPTPVRATPDYFLRWFEEIIYRILFDSLPPKSNKPGHERLSHILDSLNRLGMHFISSNKKGIIVIDGLDDISKNDIENFFSILPSVLPSSIKIIFVATAVSVLPSRLSSLVIENEVAVKPLPLEQIEEFIKAHPSSSVLNKSQVTALAEKSEGHPLYLRYLIQYIQESVFPNDEYQFESWLDSIPIISGNIEIYYNKIWAKFSDNQSEFYLAAILAKIRQPIPSSELLKLLPAASKVSFVTALDKIKHLLKAEKNLSIYHTSFSEFINRKTDILSPEIHNTAANYCLNYTNTFFSVSEIIFHLCNGTYENKLAAISKCNQSWVDQCALYSVKPDLVLADISKVITIAADEGKASSVISLLLLSQRVNFRYNTLFSENSIFLVNALLSLGKPDEALRYVIRNKTLTVADGDAIYLLQRFFEYDFFEQADILLNGIERTYTNLLEKGLDSESFNRFIILKFRSLALESNNDPKEAYEKYRYFKKVILNYAKQNGNSQQVVDTLQDEIEAFHGGYYLWRYSMPSTLREIDAKKLLKLDSKFAGKTALSVLKAKEFKEISPILGEKGSIAQWTADIEFISDKYGLCEHYDEAVITVLIEESQRSDLTEKYIQQHFSTIPSYEMRSKNGVDFDKRAFQAFTLHAESMGFIDKSVFGNPEKINYNWEKGIEILIGNIWWISGKLNRFRSDNKLENVNSFKNKILNLLECLSFPLTQRMHWERSYGIPETLFLYLYKKINRILITFFPELIPQAIQPILDKKEYQLGLYSEGYIDVLFAIAKSYAKYPNHHLQAGKVTKILSEYILTTIENRWERNEYILRLVELYAQIGNTDKAREMFIEMIAYSMGPSWYKEAQLGIINSAISNIVPKSGDFSYLTNFGAQLHHASGEMTFQRYVRQQQEQVVGNLASIGQIRKAIDYFKFLVLPDFSQAIFNAESGNVDMPVPGKGYVLGAKAIDEQAGVFELLNSIDCGTSPFAWGLCELWMHGDEFHSLDMLKINISILKSADSLGMRESKIFVDRLTRFIVSETDKSYMNDLLNSLSNQLNSNLLITLKDSLKKIGVEFDISLNTGTEESGQSYDDPLDYLTSIHSEIINLTESDNYSAARKLLIKTLNDLQQNKYSVWTENYSGKINDLRNQLPQLYQTSKNLVVDLTSLFINEPYTEEWIIADKLMELLKDMPDEDEKQEILAAVSNHIELMVRTPESIKSNYVWLSENRTLFHDRDEHLLEFLIWFLNHPALTIKNRTMEILAWLGKNYPHQVLPALLREILSEGTKISKELSAAILHQIASAKPEVVWTALKDIISENEAEILDIEHFMVRSTIIATLKSIMKTGIDDCSEFLHKLNSYDKKTSTGEDVFLEEEYLAPVDNYIYELNKLGILSREFCKDFLISVETNLPLSVKDTIKADKYIGRSFNNYNDIQLVSQYVDILRYSLNCTISKYIPAELVEDASSILRYYQPTFPENKLTLNGTPFPRLKEVIQKMFNSPSPDLSGLYNYKYTILYFWQEENEGYEMQSKTFDVTAFLVNKNISKPEDLIYPVFTFPANGYPKAETIKEDESAIPLVAKASYDAVPGSDYVPALLLPKASDILTSNALESLSYRYWRYGRRWEKNKSGKPYTIGNAILIKNSELKKLAEQYKLIWAIRLGLRKILVDVFNKKII
jgi:hypothetical protein